MDKPLVSVLMVNYNREDTVKESIESVLNQTYSNLQMIIVDDGSTDRSCDIISSINDSRVELYPSSQNRHICYATNSGFEKVKGSYLARIDSDDVWYPDKIERQMEFLASHPEYRICFSWIDLIDENGRNINHEQEPLLKMFEKNFQGQTDSLRYFFFEGNCLSHPSVLMETSLMKEIGGFSPGYMQSHDYDYWVRIAKRTPLYILPERLLAMRRFMNEGNTGNNSSHEMENDIRFYNEYADIKQHFFDGMDDTLFIETFRPYFRCRDSHTPLELECEKAFLLLWESTQSNGLLPAGVSRFFELFQRREAGTLLEDKFHFSVKDFYRLTKHHMYYDRWQEKLTEDMKSYNAQLAEMQGKLDALESENAHLKIALKTYADSFCWKATRPLRIILDCFKKKK